jgi:hypothetical protein
MSVEDILKAFRADERFKDNVAAWRTARPG